MKPKLELIRTITNRLMGALALLVCVSIPGTFFAKNSAGGVPTALAVFAVGIIGGVVGLQRRLKKMSPDDLMLLANSWVYVCLSPLVGGILAVVTYVFFVSGVLRGTFFPEFEPDPAPLPDGLARLFAVHGVTAADYGKMLLWGFIAGFSERFATDIINRFEANAADEVQPEKSQATLETNPGESEAKPERKPNA